MVLTKLGNVRGLSKGLMRAQGLEKGIGCAVALVIGGFNCIGNQDSRNWARRELQQGDRVNKGAKRCDSVGNDNLPGWGMGRLS